MAEAGTWENIRERGLISASALLDLFDVPELRHTTIETQRRPKDECICHPEHGLATIRSQTPIPLKILKRVLTDDMDPSEWCRLLNPMVFFLAE
jgi:hypothetical protein